MKPGTYVISRRQIIGAGIAGLGAALLTACESVKAPDAPQLDFDPTVTAMVAPPTGTVATGLTVPISFSTGEAFLYVPSGYQAATPSPLVLMFHGEGQTAYSAISLFQPHADAAGLVLLAIDSVATTWDIFAEGGFGPDVDFMNAALTVVFKVVNVDPARIAVEGFSDGAAYALAVGRTNGNFFSRIIAFSVTAVPGTALVGRPKIFMAHGISDPIVTIAAIGDPIDASLVPGGYNLDSVRFDGGHEVPDSVAQQAIAWLAT